MSAGPQYSDIDQKVAFDHCQSQLGSPSVSNFVVQFNDETARCATNLSRSDVAHVLQHRQSVESQSQCLWLNLWSWSAEHHEIVKLIAQEYDVSPRLAHMLSPKPTITGNSSSSSSQEPASDSSQVDDLEKAKPTITSSGAQRRAVSAQRKHLASIADVVNDLWHFYSLDFGNRYISLSWNALFFLPDGETSSDPSKPNAVRIWSSLLLCDDGTILSVFECPPSCPPDMIKRIRFNQLNTFRHLTKSSPLNAIPNPLMRISVRSPNNKVKSSRAEMASLMLYYLFDDWLNIYAQVAGGSDSYRYRLDQIRDQMIASPDVNQVKTLHSLGRQLVVLKSIYRSYQAIIERVIQRLKTSASHNPAERIRSSDSLHQMATSTSNHQGSITSLPDGFVDPVETQVRLSPNAIARFERLLDRIEICALTEVEECLKEKEAMVLMNFNLIQLTESRAIEKLTRTTILLAKVTILFLPLSLVSGYFSLQFAAIDEIYSLRTFWLTFMVVAIVTVIFLVGSSALGFRYAERGFYRGWLKNVLPGGRKRDA